MGNICLEDEFYIKLKSPCLPINWISASDFVRFEGAGSIFISGFAKLNEQMKPIHITLPRLPVRQIEPIKAEIARERFSDDIIFSEPRSQFSPTEDRTISATEADIGSPSTVYTSLGNGSDIGIILPSTNPARCDGTPGSPFGPAVLGHSTVIIQLDLRVSNCDVAGNNCTWEHILKVDIQDRVQRFEFTEPFKIKDSRFLTFNDLINGVDFENEQIPNIPTFCNKNLTVTQGIADFHNKLIVNDSSIPKEINTPLDNTPFKFFDNGISHISSFPISCSMTESISTEVREYWMLEPLTPALEAAFNPATPNDAIFDDITSLASMVEAAPGLDASIFGILRTTKGTLNSFSFTSNSTIFGVASNEEVVRMSHSEGVDLGKTTNTIQFSKGKKLFAGNGGEDLEGF